MPKNIQTPPTAEDVSREPEDETRDMGIAFKFAHDQGLAEGGLLYLDRVNARYKNIFGLLAAYSAAENARLTQERDAFKTTAEHYTDDADALTAERDTLRRALEQIVNKNLCDCSDGNCGKCLAEAALKGESAGGRANTPLPSYCATKNGPHEPASDPQEPRDPLKWYCPKCGTACAGICLTCGYSDHAPNSWIDKRTPAPPSPAKVSESVRERARKFFDCVTCAGSGRVMTGAVQSDVCGKCNGIGAKPITISEVVAFAESESSLARKQEREECARLVCHYCAEPEKWKPAAPREGGVFKGEMRHEKADDKHYTAECYAAAIHERSREGKG